MRIKIFLLAVACSFGVMDSYAQKGVDNGTQYGSGEDSVRCIQNISLFVPYAKANNFKDAYDFWKIVYEECPAATKDIYLYGVRIVAWQIDNEKDPAKKAELINDLMGVYDKRVKYFGDDQRYGKDWIVGRKAQDYIKYTGDKGDATLLYGWLKEVVDQYGNQTDALAVSLLMYASFQRLSADENFKPNYIADYLKASEILDKQLEAAVAANNEKEQTALMPYKQVVDGAFANSGAADCETLQSIYAPKVEENKDNLQYLKETISLLRRMRCNEIEAYFAAAEYAHKVEPTSESAMGLARQAVKRNDYATAITFFEEAANLETDPVVKGEDYYMIAVLCADQNQYARAKQYCLKAVEANPNYGQPYLLIGKLYAQTANSIFPNDNVMKKTVYYAAVDKFERARSVDPSVASEANSLINTYRAYFPSTEEIFMHPDLEKGNQITIPGWINERTSVR
ncbi:MAG: hypothetical protein LIP01_11690 [Tannerellaceae bacterium]|nr:hypothetical protein [Tannerellaceae bacterium]